PLESIEQYSVYDSACIALEVWLRNYFKTTWFAKQKLNWINRLTKLTEKALHRVESYIQSINQWEQTRNPEEIGHLLMANLHQIPPQATEIEVEDFYRNQQKLTIKLNPDLTPQQNAELYYKKQKERKQELAHLEQLLEQAMGNHERLSKGLTELTNIANQRELNKFVKQNTALWQKAEGDEQLPFRVFEKLGYQIMVGKNAQSNDTLTVSYAKKDDLWLHAKDVSGSHVVIRKKDAHSIPKPVIEYAAGLAAYYSKYRRQKWVAVSYTPRKYVRKNKQLAPGQVIIDREEVIFVSPPNTPV
ncbi:MAG: NFACT RNA binding domain-containing protein, partial [Bacteroidia bacterium]|nr:NFACT RNA binding domain-containing protein [Bacteroidia bacterium]